MYKGGGAMSDYNTNIAYVYDGSFYGLLSCVYASFYQREIPTAIYRDDDEIGILFPVKEISTDDVAAQKVETSIVSKICQDALMLVYRCYLSNIDNRELVILHFLRLGYRVGAKVVDMLANEVVHIITKASRRVGGEAHAYKGLLRFSEYNGALVAVIEPVTFVLPLLAQHFCDRFPSEQLMIYDKTHKHIFVYQNNERHLFPLEKLELPPADADEEMYRALWRRFYETIAIEGRINPKLRMGNMPKRYWAQLTEMSGHPNCDAVE